MSLWFESLSLGLYDYADNQKERARCIISHLSMRVPRSWWERALETSHVEETHASVICEMKEILSKIKGFEGINSGLLVALAFIETPDKLSSQKKIQPSLKEAGKVLTENLTR